MFHSHVWLRVGNPMAIDRFSRPICEGCKVSVDPNQYGVISNITVKKILSSSDTNQLTFYLTYILSWYLAVFLPYILKFHLAFYLPFLLVFYLAYILTFYLAFFLALYLTCVLTFDLACFLAFYLASSLAFFLASIRTFSLACVRIQAPLHQGLAIWLGSMAEEEPRRRRDEEEGAVPSLKSRDPHLADGEKTITNWFDINPPACWRVWLEGGVPVLFLACTCSFSLLLRVLNRVTTRPR